MSLLIDPLALKKGFPENGNMSEKIKWLVDNYGKDIIAAVKGSGICFPLVVAQFCEESFFGANTKAQRYNNFAGIKNQPKGATGKTVTNYAIFPYASTCFDTYINYVLLDPTKAYNKNNQLVNAQSPIDQLKIIADNGYYQETGNRATDSAIYQSHVSPILKKVIAMYPFSKIA